MRLLRQLGCLALHAGHSVYGIAHPGTPHCLSGGSRTQRPHGLQDSLLGRDNDRTKHTATAAAVAAAAAAAQCPSLHFTLIFFCERWAADGD